MSSLHHIKKHIMEPCPIIGDISFDYFVKVMSTTSLHCTVTVFHFAINLQTVTWRLISCKYPVPPQTLNHQFYQPLMILCYIKSYKDGCKVVISIPPKLYHCFHIYQLSLHFKVKPYFPLHLSMYLYQFYLMDICFIQRIIFIYYHY